MATSVGYNVRKWIDENKQFFQPPVCNKHMHDNQINVMFVGGPNKRSDYHIEAGEELFFQLKGDMLLKIVEQGQHRDVLIREGEIFLLPRAIPHSPQRFANSVGLVIERSRSKEEIDGLRFYTTGEDGTPLTTALFEVWFQWDENKQNMGHYFNQFYNSEQYKTGRPIPGAIAEKSPLDVDSETVVESPFNLSEWIENNASTIDSTGRLALFDPQHHQLQVFVYGKGEIADCFDDAETWIWQMKGDSLVTFASTAHRLVQDDSILVPPGQRFCVSHDQEGSWALVCSQVPYQPDSRGRHGTPSRS